MAHHTPRRRSSQPAGIGRAVRTLLTLSVAIAALLAALPVTAAQETPAATGAIEVHVSSCPPGYDGSSHFDACHASGLAGVEVRLTGPASDARVTEGDTGAVRFADIPAGEWTIEVVLPDEGQRYETYCSLEGSDTRVPMSPEDSNPGSVSLAEGQAVICDVYVIPAAEATAAPDPGETELARIAVDPASCPEGTDPEADFDALAEQCSGPVDGLTFTWGDASGPIETYDTDAADDGQVLIEGIESGSYTLYSDVPLASATEVLYCVADGGDRYRKQFDESGVTTFTDIQREQIACDWFIVPLEAEPEPTVVPTGIATQDPVVTPTPDAAAPTEPAEDSGDGRGVESGASVTVHLALCPIGYEGDELYDTCHGTGVSDQEFVLTGPDGEVSAVTTVPQTPGPGIVEFTGLPAGDYTLAGGPPGDVGSVRLYCTTQPDGAFVETALDSTRAGFPVGEGEDLLCDWYYIPDNAQGETPVPTATAEPESRAEILVTLLACEPGATLSGAGYDELHDACQETRDGIEFRLSDPGAPPLTAATGVSGPGAVRFYDLLPADYTLAPSLPQDLRTAAVYCQIDDGERYQKSVTDGATTFVDVDGESIACSWFVTRSVAPTEVPKPDGPTGSITVREFVCEADQSKIEDWERECEAGSSGATFTVASTDGSISLTSATNASGIATFDGLPDGFYTLRQNDGVWCKAKAERVDSKSRVIVEGGQNTDVFLYQCSQVTDLPNTGSGPGIAPIERPAWWQDLTMTQFLLMGAGVLGGMILVGWGAGRVLSVRA